MTITTWLNVVKAVRRLASDPTIEHVSVKLESGQRGDRAAASARVKARKHGLSVETRVRCGTLHIARV